MRSVVQSLENGAEGRWDDLIQSGNQLLYEFHQISRSSILTQNDNCYVRSQLSVPQAIPVMFWLGTTKYCPPWTTITLLLAITIFTALFAFRGSVPPAYFRAYAALAGLASRPRPGMQRSKAVENERISGRSLRAPPLRSASLYYHYVRGRAEVTCAMPGTTPAVVHFPDQRKKRQ